MLDNKQILVNMIKCPDSTILESRSTHDYQTHTQEDGQEFMVDGGLEYLRRSGEGYEELSMTMEAVDDYEDYCTLRERFTWGNNYNKDMNRLPETIYVKLKDITEGHLDALIEYTETRGRREVNQLFWEEKHFRGRECLQEKIDTKLKCLLDEKGSLIYPRDVGIVSKEVFGLINTYVEENK